MTDFDVAETFRKAWDENERDRIKRSPNFKPEDYTATGRASAAYGGKRNKDWWLDNGPQMVQDWIDWRLAERWSVLAIDGKPAIEVELNFQIPGVDVPIKSFIDRVMVTRAGEGAILDLKTGRTPETAEQLGLYRVGLGIVHNIWVDWGYFWSPGGKGHGNPIDLRAWTPERFAVMFNNSINAINAKAFNPSPANNCKAWCGVARYCAVTGGSEAAGVDSLAV